MYLQKKLFTLLVAWESLKLTKKFPLDPKKIKKMQAQKLKKVMKSAWKFDFYRQRFLAAGLKEGEMITPEMLHTLPPLTKAEYRDFVNAEVAKKPGKYKHWCQDETSGSTGMPLIVYSTQRERAVNVAKWLRVLAVNGHRALNGQVLCVILPQRIPKRKPFFQKLGLYKRETISQLTPIPDMVETFNKVRPTLFYANKSYYVMMALYATKHHVPLFRPKAYICGSETMDDISRALIFDTFGREGFAEHYGCTETGNMAFTKTGDPDRLYLCHDTNIFTVLDDQGQPTDDGRLLVTSLFQTGFPIINYAIGDVVESIVEADGLRYLHKIKGRCDSVIKLPGEDMISLYYFYILMEKRRELLQFKVIQKELDHFHFLLVKKPDNQTKNSEIEAIITDELRETARNGELTVTFEWVEEIPPEKNGKIRIVVAKE